MKGQRMILEKKKVLITGAGGFIGSYLTERLLEAGCIVKAFIHYKDAKKEFKLKK